MAKKYFKVSGWGATQPDKGPNSDILQFVTVTTVDCEDDDPRIGHPNFNICAETVVGTSGICTSDIGGPLIVGCGLAGIASWHHSPCGSEPDAYVRISWYRSWIRGATGV
jgi:secreted trypsin-like serine protease